MTNLLLANSQKKKNGAVSHHPQDLHRDSCDSRDSRRVRGMQRWAGLQLAKPEVKSAMSPKTRKQICSEVVL